MKSNAWKRPYVYFRDCGGSTRYDRGYFLHGACGKEVVGSDKGKKIFDVIIWSGNFLFLTSMLYKKVTHSG